MKGKKLLLTIVCFVIIGSLLAGFGLGCKGTTTTTTTKETKTLEIGSIMALTGWFAPNEVVGSRELNCYVDYVNENGGITIGDTNYTIKIISIDNQSTLDGTAAAANQLAYQNKVKFVLEPLGFLSISGNSIFTENKIVAFCPYNTMIPDEIGTFTPYKFIGSVSLYGNILGAFEGIKVNFPDVKSVVCVNQDDGTIAGTSAVIDIVAPATSLTVVGDFISYAPDAVDFNPVASLLNAASADAVVMTGGPYNHVAAVIKALRSMGNEKPFIYVGQLDGQALIEIIGEEYATNIQTLGIIEDPNNPQLLNELIQRMQTKYNDTFVSGVNANCLYVLLQGIEAAQSLDTDVVKAKLESMTTFDTIYGAGSWGGLVTYGIKHAVVNPIPTQLIMNGECTMGPFVTISIP
ncbi:MAG: ABC transporter substrate-binding protein [Dehalococcoidales bacterium]|nr:ABC transporter substrate-binding protein [Dehalococcoidales bacterium]